MAFSLLVEVSLLPRRHLSGIVSAGARADTENFRVNVNLMLCAGTGSDKGYTVCAWVRAGGPFIATMCETGRFRIDKYDVTAYSAYRYELIIIYPLIYLISNVGAIALILPNKWR